MYSPRGSHSNYKNKNRCRKCTRPHDPMASPDGTTGPVNLPWVVVKISPAPTDADPSSHGSNRTSNVGPSLLAARMSRFAFGPVDDLFFPRQLQKRAHRASSILLDRKQCSKRARSEKSSGHQREVWLLILNWSTTCMYVLLIHASKWGITIVIPQRSQSRRHHSPEPPPRLNSLPV